jgi:hypothetical protein
MTTKILRVRKWSGRELSLSKMFSGSNAFEISDIQEDEAEAIVPKRPECNNITLV